MKKSIIYFFLLFAILLVTGCSKYDNTKIITIASKKVVVENIHGEQLNMYLYKENDSDTKWSIYSSYIGNFEYESGYEYIIKVGVVSPDLNLMDDEGYSDLLKIISKIKKESENLPSDTLISDR